MREESKAKRVVIGIALPVHYIQLEINGLGFFISKITLSSLEQFRFGWVVFI